MEFVTFLASVVLMKDRDPWLCYVWSRTRCDKLRLDSNRNRYCG